MLFFTIIYIQNGQFLYQFFQKKNGLFFKQKQYRFFPSIDPLFFQQIFYYKKKKDAFW